jgi:hypothetical protein
VRLRVSGVEPFGEQTHLRASRRVLLLGLLDQRTRQRLEARVRRQADGIVEVLALALVVEGRDGKAAVST